MQPKAFFGSLLEQADIRINGTRPWDVQVHDNRLYTRALRYGSLGIGEAYMDGWWDVEDLDGAIYRAASTNFQDTFKLDFGVILATLRETLINPQRAKVTEVAEKHYDIGNDLYERMLDKRMIYSCGYWKDAKTLDEAQEAKLDLICRKVGLQPGMRVLDIGSGWGGFLKFAAERYGITGVGITVSKEQAALANASTDGLPIETRLVDYMAMDGKFDRVISIGMFEHVGAKNYKRYMKKVRSLLEDDGLFLLHTIGGNWATKHGDPWVIKYIFPHGMIPGPENLTESFAHDFTLEDWHNFGPDYDKTLMAWSANFEAAWPDLKDKYGERFHRMWHYYLHLFAAQFRVRHTNLWQLVLSPKGVKGGYASIR
jgi:cyclopropane-fatty-acyl-phospholipid synthase